MNQVDRIFMESKDSKQFVDKYLKHLQNLLQSIDTSAVAEFIAKLFEARAENRQIFFIGNGGSAATASHFANDIAIGSRTASPPFRAISLTDNNAVMTAIANDFGYDELFVKQLEKLFQPGDMVVAISASGNSPNLIKAVEWTKQRKGFVVGLTGFDGGKLKQMSNLCLHVATEKGEYGPVEDIHMVVDHIVGSYLMRKVAKGETSS